MEPKKSLERTMELLQEAARRANWDAQHGPRHLRTGRFFVSSVMGAHAFTENDNAAAESPPTPSDPARAGLQNSVVGSDGFQPEE